jgi:hypothetical protein
VVNSSTPGQSFGHIDKVPATVPLKRFVEGRHQIVFAVEQLDGDSARFLRPMEG